MEPETEEERCRCVVLEVLNEIQPLEDWQLYQKVCASRAALNRDIGSFEDVLRLAWGVLGDLPHLSDPLDQRVWDAYARCNDLFSSKLEEKKRRSEHIQATATPPLPA